MATATWSALAQQWTLILKNKRHDPGLAYRRANAEHFTDTEIYDNDTHIQYDNEIQGSDFVFYHPGGLQHKTLKALRSGQINIDETLDLHGDSVNVATQVLEAFISTYQPLARHQCCVLIIHGKGTHAKSGRYAKLKSLVCQLLKQSARVLAYSSAQPKDGGTGAIYVLLKSNV